MLFSPLNFRIHYSFLNSLHISNEIVLSQTPTPSPLRIPCIHRGWIPACSGFLGLHPGCHGTFRGSRRKVGFLSRHHSGKGLHLTLRGESPGFSVVVARNLGFLSSYNGYLRDPLVLPQESPVSMQVAKGLSGFLSSQCRILGPHLELRSNLRVPLQC